MKRITLTRGIPASGKTTWAKEQLKKYPNRYKRINRDDLRLMLDNEQFNPKREKFITKTQHTLILTALEEGYHVICDDTNLNPKTVSSIMELVSGKAIIEFKDFTNVPLKTCIERDLKRKNSVGQKVIIDFYNRYLRKEPEKIQYIQDKPYAIIVDLDGTLAHMKTRGPFDFMKCDEDVVDNNIKELISFYKNKNYHIILLSGRDSICRKKTEIWLANNDINYDYLYMRKQDDCRKDSIIKKELYDEYIKGNFNIKFVLDDRDQVVNMWRETGLTCYQVAEGSF